MGHLPFPGEIADVVDERPGDRDVLVAVVMREEGPSSDQGQPKDVGHVLPPHAPRPLQQ